jgi:two-component system OmpR family sensor kinase
LILAAGYFYFLQIKNHMLRAEEFSLIEYARTIKMGGDLHRFQNLYWYTFVKNDGLRIDIRNFQENQKSFSKILPINRDKDYIKVFKSKQNYNQKLHELKVKVIIVQVVLLFIFAIISYVLAMNALKPLQESIAMLDKFAKDLIHDLNTPVTSMKLNLNILKKEQSLKGNKALARLDKSVYGISELYENLTILLEEETFLLQNINVCEIVKELIDTYEIIYQNLTFIQECKEMQVRTNASALKQLLQNIISNACKYNRFDGYVKIYSQGNILIIQDTGKGIKNPQKIFERNYSGEHSSGIGLDIVKRLSNAMGIVIDVESNEKGSKFILHFKKEEL